jgi:hypothetical protein
LTELRVLLVHGLLHLAGFDHERGEQQLQDMAQQEAHILSELGWEGSGLISLAAAEQEDEGGEGLSSAGATPSISSSSSSTDSSDSSVATVSSSSTSTPR